MLRNWQNAQIIKALSYYWKVTSRFYRNIKLYLKLQNEVPAKRA